MPDDVAYVYRDRRTGQTKTYRSDLLQKRLCSEHPRLAQDFDAKFVEDIRAVSFELSIAWGLLETGIESHQTTDEAEFLRRLGTVLRNAVNSIVAALELVRRGYTLQSGMVLRGVVEAVAVTIDVVANKESNVAFRAGRKIPKAAAGRASKYLGMIGHLFGLLSNEHTHVGRTHENDYPLDSTGDEAAKVLRMIKAATALVAISTELLFHAVVAEPRYWKRHSKALAFSPDPEVLQALKDFPSLSTDSTGPTTESPPPASCG